MAYETLFICTGNSARSILAEGLLEHLGEGRFKARSAGSHPSGTVNPLALQVLGKLGIPTAGFRSKSWEEFARPPEFDSLTRKTRLFRKALQHPCGFAADWARVVVVARFDR